MLWQKPPHVEPCFLLKIKGEKFKRVKFLCSFPGKMRHTNMFPGGIKCVVRLGAKHFGSKKVMCYLMCYFWPLKLGSQLSAEKPYSCFMFIFSFSSGKRGGGTPWLGVNSPALILSKTSGVSLAKNRLKSAKRRLNDGYNRLRSAKNRLALAKSWLNLAKREVFISQLRRTEFTHNFRDGVPKVEGGRWGRKGAREGGPTGRPHQVTPALAMVAPRRWVVQGICLLSPATATHGTVVMDPTWVQTQATSQLPWVVRSVGQCVYVCVRDKS